MMQVFRSISLSIMVLGIGASPALASESYDHDLYLEAVDLPALDLFSFAARMRRFLSDTMPIRPYFQLGLEHTSPVLRRFEPSQSTYVYVAPGVAFSWGAFSLFGELRARAFAKHAEDKESSQKLIDARVISVLGDYRQVTLRPDQDMFVETYAEAVYTSADQNNIQTAGFVRSGWQYAFLPQVKLGLVAEPFVAVDRHNSAFNNRAEVRVGPRVAGVVGDLSWALYASRVATHYFAWGEGKDSLDDKRFSHRFLLVCGGRF